LGNLQKAASGLSALLFFIYGGQPLNADVPLGEFRIKYAIGNYWCGDADLFGNDTVFGEADNTFTFERTVTDGGYSISHRTVELSLQRNGNLVSERNSRSEVFGRR
jgi:hypothetical protein